MPGMWDLEEKDFEPYDECDHPLTDAQIKAIRNMAYHRAVQMMRQGHWSTAEETAYWNGVMAAFFATRSNLKIPACWLLRTDISILEVVVRWKADGKLSEGA